MASWQSLELRRLDCFWLGIIDEAADIQQTREHMGNVHSGHGDAWRWKA